MIPKSYLSYSNGSQNIDPYKFRPVESASNHFSFIYSNHLEFANILSKDPLIITCYPSSLGFIEGFSVVDTYLRTNTFNQAISLASAEKKPLIIIGQPLITTHLLLNSLNSNIQIPNEIGIALGGYYCPESLEKALKNIFINCNLNIIHGYGVAEVQFGLLIGKRINSNDPILYKLASPDIKIKIEKNSSELILQKNSESKEYKTGDLISEEELNQEKFFKITQNPSKLSPNVLKQLNSWTEADWQRKTGYLNKSDKKTYFQLRPFIKPLNEYEVEFFDYMRQFAMNWHDKPDWSEK